MSAFRLKLGGFSTKLVFTPDGPNMTHNDPGGLCMSRDDIPGVRGVPGGPGGRQGAPWATRLLPTPK